MTDCIDSKTIEYAETLVRTYCCPIGRSTDETDVEFCNARDCFERYMANQECVAAVALRLKAGGDA